jgi:phage terminase large subunit-like protein
VGVRLESLARLIGQPFMPWQAQVANVAGELLPDGRPAFREVRVTVPRQSGKTTLILVVEVDRSLNWGGRQRCLYAAQDRNSSREKWAEQVDLLRDSPLRRLVKVRQSNGSERILWPSTGSTVGITASGETSGHGQTLDLGVIDEAFAQRDERLMQAFRPAALTRPNAQIWVVSTMGGQESFFLHDRVDDGRARVEAGETAGVAYFEWSAGDDDDPDDPATWWRCMPALGRTVTEEVIRADHDAMEPGEFARAYLNRRASGGRPVIDAASWQACRDGRSQLAGLPCFAVDVTPPRDAGSVAVAGWRSDRRRHIEIVDHRPGTDWMVARLVDLQRRWQPLPVVVDPASPAGSLLVDMAGLGVATATVNAREYAQGCGQFYDAIVDGQVCHLDQPVLGLAVAAARKRVLGDAWAWARKTGGDISPLVAVTLAHWGLVKAGLGDPQIL